MSLDKVICNAQAESGASPPDAGAAAAVDKRPAGLRRRLAAAAYDWVLLAGVIAIYGFAAVLLRGGVAVEPNTPWFSAGLVAIPAVFFGWFWTHGGQTLGMLAWRIEVVTVGGGPLRWRHALIRFFAAALSLLPAGLGFLWSIPDREHATWHDRLSGTRTVMRRAA